MEQNFLQKRIQETLPKLCFQNNEALSENRRHSNTADLFRNSLFLAKSPYERLKYSLRRRSREKLKQRQQHIENRISKLPSHASRDPFSRQFYLARIKQLLAYDGGYVSCGKNKISRKKIKFPPIETNTAGEIRHHKKDSHILVSETLNDNVTSSCDSEFLLRPVEKIYIDSKDMEKVNSSHFLSSENYKEKRERKEVKSGRSNRSFHSEEFKSNSSKKDESFKGDKTPEENPYLKISETDLQCKEQEKTLNVMSYITNKECEKLVTETSWEEALVTYENPIKNSRTQGNTAYDNPAKSKLDKTEVSTYTTSRMEEICQENSNDDEDEIDQLKHESDEMTHGNNDGGKSITKVFSETQNINKEEQCDEVKDINEENNDVPFSPAKNELLPEENQSHSLDSNVCSFSCRSSQLSTSDKMTCGKKDEEKDDVSEEDNDPSLSPANEKLLLEDSKSHSQLSRDEKRPGTGHSSTTSFCSSSSSCQSSSTSQLSTSETSDTEHESNSDSSSATSATDILDSMREVCSPGADIATYVGNGQIGEMKVFDEEATNQLIKNGYEVFQNSESKISSSTQKDKDATTSSENVREAVIAEKQIEQSIMDGKDPKKTEIYRIGKDINPESRDYADKEDKLDKLQKEVQNKNIDFNNAYETCSSGSTPELDSNTCDSENGNQSATLEEKTSIKNMEGVDKHKQEGTIPDNSATRSDSVRTRTDSAGTRSDSARTRFDSVGTKFDSVGTRSDPTGTRTDSAETRSDSAGTRSDSAATDSGSDSDYTEDSDSDSSYTSTTDSETSGSTDVLSSSESESECKSEGSFVDEAVMKFDHDSLKRKLSLTSAPKTLEETWENTTKKEENKLDNNVLIPEQKESEKSSPSPRIPKEDIRIVAEREQKLILMKSKLRRTSSVDKYIQLTALFRKHYQNRE